AMILVTIIPWFIWWKFADKKRLIEIFSFGLLIMFISVFFAPIKQNFNLWQFIHRVHWSLSTPLFPYDITILPVTYMFIYQFSKNWTSYVIGTLLLSCFMAFILMPMFIKLDLILFISYRSHFIALTVLIIIALFSRWFIYSHLSRKAL
ncbi:MAG TPA: hypothetical protein DDY49_12745, partial [Paenibacillaceae bacterium]|nr:hypothetical protein [Paenibacillaceae bacterium]